MSLINRLYFLLLLALLSSGSGRGQLFNDMGGLSGSGLSVLPTATIAPSAEFRCQYSRLSYLQTSGNGMNVIGLSSGFSPNLEGYIRLTGEQAGTFSSQLAYGFGAKFRVPTLLPVIRRLAFWVETTMSDFSQESALYPPDALRAGMTTTVDSNGIHPTLFLGVAVMNDRAHALVGGGVTIAAGHSTQIGFEIMHGYWSLNSSQFTASLSYRVFPNVSLQIVPGYLSTAGTSTWTMSLGVSCSTADIDFHPFFEQDDRKEEFTLPSIDEIERQTQKEKQE